MGHLMSRRLPLRGLALLVALCGGLSPRPVEAFPYVVQQGETVAQLAERMYGRVELERLVVQANGLEGRRGAAIVPGMRLEIPAVGYHKALPGDTWKSIASTHLGEPKRADVLAHYNDTHPWLPPAIGREVLIPYNLRYVASRGDTTESVAYRFLGRRDKAWVIASYNRLRRAKLLQGEVLLVPLVELSLTDAGRKAAVDAGALIRSQSGGRALETQREAAAAIPRLVQAVRRGRYIDGIARGAALLSQEGLTEPQLATVHRQLTEAYVALDERGAAATSCAKWREHDPAAALDPIELSPKIIEVCLGRRPEAVPSGPETRGVVGAPEEESDP